MESSSLNIEMASTACFRREQVPFCQGPFVPLPGSGQLRMIRRISSRPGRVRMKIDRLSPRWVGITDGLDVLVSHGRPRGNTVFFTVRVPHPLPSSAIVRLPRPVAMDIFSCLPYRHGPIHMCAYIMVTMSILQVQSVRTRI